MAMREVTGLLPKLLSPTRQKVLLQVIRFDKTPGGIVIPEVSQGKDVGPTPRAWVVCCGPDCKEVKRGDLILSLATEQCHIVRYKDQELALVEEDSIIAVVDGETHPKIQI